MSAKLVSRIPEYDILIVRCFLIIIGCIAIWWGAFGFYGLWQQSSVERIADRIIAGQPFTEAALTRQLPTIERIERAVWCQPAALRSAAIIRLRMFAVAESASDHKPADEDLKSLGNVFRRSLSCLPADPFLWLVLSSVEGTQKSIQSGNLKYLRMSYQLGPNEGWIGIKRNRLALAEFEKLPADLTVSATNEFISLLASGFYYHQVADIFISQDSRVRKLLLSRLVDVAERPRRAFVNVLHEKGEDVAIPGIERDESRPWRRK
jgi:hypothetical protein